MISTTSLGSRGHLVSIQRSSHALSAASPQRLEFSAILEAVLTGHEDWVFSVAWHPRVRIPLVASASESAASASVDPDAAFKWHQPLCLLTASMDKSMMVWRPDRASSLWLNEVRVGEVGGHTLGFAGGLFGPRGAALLAHGCNGAFHLWRNAATSASASASASVSSDSSSALPLTAADEAGDRSWRPALVPAGHFAGVQDLCWDATQQYVVSTALDQTTRIVAPWVAGAGADHDGDSADGDQVVWHEIARPQTHGFDLHCVCALPAVPARTVVDADGGDGSIVFDDDHAIAPAHRFASGAEEKVLRFACDGDGCCRAGACFAAFSLCVCVCL